MKKQKDLEMRNCLYCKKDFLTRIAAQKYCSVKCGSKAHKEKCEKDYKENGFYNGKWASLRWAVLSRDQFRCQYCGRTPSKHGIELHVDHINPRINGGLDDENNLITSCVDCNLGKGEGGDGEKIKVYFGEKDFRIGMKNRSLPCNGGTVLM